jgi:hypothetical protein
MQNQLLASWQPPDSTTRSISFQGLNLLDVPFILVCGFIQLPNSSDQVNFRLSEQGTADPGPYSYRVYRSDAIRTGVFRNGLTNSTTPLFATSNASCVYFEATITGRGRTYTNRVNIANSYSNTAHTNNYRNYLAQIRQNIFSYDDATNTLSHSGSSSYEYQGHSLLLGSDTTFELITTGDMSTDSFVKIYTLTE